MCHAAVNEPNAVYRGAVSGSSTPPLKGAGPVLHVRSPSMAQLRRIFVATPPSAAPLFGCRPVLKLDVAGPLHQTTDELDELMSSGSRAPVESGRSSVPVTGSGSSGQHPLGAHCLRNVVTRYQGTSPTYAFAVATNSPVALPPNSLCAITLPFAFGIPVDWVDPSAAQYLRKTDGQGSFLTAMMQKGEGTPFVAGCVLKGSVLFPL
eukprot:gene27778-7415_t